MSRSYFLLFIGLTTAQAILTNSMMLLNGTSHPTSTPSFRAVASGAPSQSPTAALFVAQPAQSDTTEASASNTELFGLPPVIAGVIMGALGAIALVSLIYIIQRSLLYSYQFSKVSSDEGTLIEEATNPVTSAAGTSSPERHGLVAGMSSTDKEDVQREITPTRSGKHSRHGSRL